MRTKKGERGDYEGRRREEIGRKMDEGGRDEMVLNVGDLELNRTKDPDPETRSLRSLERKSRSDLRRLSRVLDRYVCFT